MLDAEFARGVVIAVICLFIGSGLGVFLMCLLRIAGQDTPTQGD